MSDLYKVLSIDDSRSVHAFLDRCLNESGKKEYQFIHAMGVKEGLQKLESEKISVVLLDWEMPEITGLEGIVMIMGVDEFMDMARTSVNLLGNCVATTVVARWEGESLSPDFSAKVP